MNTQLEKITEPAVTETSDPRWQAVLDRNAALDGQFVFGVKTTGIYCRPSCPARHAKRANISFFASPAIAEQAGYRACLRCRPKEGSLEEQHRALVEQACRLIEESETALSLDPLAAHVGLSPSHFHRLFKVSTGLTPKEYGQAHRMKRVHGLLNGSQESITNVILDAGYNSNSRFYEKSNEMLGMTPTQYRKGGQDTKIEFAIAETSLGALLVAQSEKGICSIMLNDEPEPLAEELQRIFPHAAMIGDDPAFAALVAKVVSLVENPSAMIDLPLDIRGTAFQLRVWDALRQIKPGSTLSYTQLAEKIGSPKAVRAVAGACAANKLAIAIPCHRIIRTDGGLSGYRWGVERKQKLLDRELKS